MEVAPDVKQDLQPFPILIFNGGSSSIKFSIYSAQAADLTLLYSGEASGIGTSKAHFSFCSLQNGERQNLISETAPPDLDSSRGAVQKIAAILNQPGLPRPVAIGHRVVHTGPKLHAHQRITPYVLEEIEKAICFAPLHQPIGLEIIREVMQSFPGVDNYACFDTIFHQTMPEVSSIYPLPKEIREQGVHRYGFHGLAGESIIDQFLQGRVPSPAVPGQTPGRLVYAHLGSGASIATIHQGKSIDISLGLTPCGGILMGTRPGDLDPGLIFYLLRTYSGSAAEATAAVEQMLNKQSGMLALSGLSNDMRILRDAARQGNAEAALAIEAFALSSKKVIGSSVARMGGIDALVFAGGIGERDAQTRASICAGMDCFGLLLDEEKNSSMRSGPCTISRPDSKVAVYVLPADEDRIIAGHVARLAR